MIASCTAIPKMEMNPIAAEMERCVPVTQSAITPPLHATGIETSTISMSRKPPTAE